MKKINKNIFIIGPTGSGKSTLGFELSKIIKMEFFDSDLEIEKKNKKSINEIFKDNGELFFRNEEENLIEKLSNKKNVILSTGGGCIESKTNRENLLSKGIIIYLKTDIYNQLIRLKKNKNRPVLNNTNKIEILNNLYKKRNHLYEEISNIIISTNKKSINNIICDILKILNKQNINITH